MKPAARCAHGGARWFGLLTSLALILTGPAPAFAQGGLPIPRPADERPDLPAFEPPERKPGKILPPLRLPDEPDTLGLARGKRVTVRAYRITGNTAIPTEELEALAQPYTDREVSFDELAELRDRLTLAYVERGYVTSAAEIPDQRRTGGSGRRSRPGSPRARPRRSAGGRRRPRAKASPGGEGTGQRDGFGLRQPVYRSESTELSLSLVGEWRRSATSVLGQTVLVSKVAPLRVGLEWSYSARRRAVAARSVMSFGLPIPGVTKNQGPIPGGADGEYFVWLGQVQAARRFGFLDLQLLARLDLQVSDSPLLSLEQLSMGGANTVRGYRENTLVGDNGVIGSFELRLPVWRRPESLFLFELAPFFDGGHSWNTDRPTVGPETLLSVGIGARLAFTHRARFQIYWGHPIKNVTTDESVFGEYNLQDDGIHLALTLEWP